MTLPQLFSDEAVKQAALQYLERHYHGIDLNPAGQMPETAPGQLMGIRNPQAGLTAYLGVQRSLSAKAALATKLANEHWLAVPFHPACHNPYELIQLEHACRSAGTGLLVMRTDQQNEVKRLCCPAFRPLDGSRLRKKQAEPPRRRYLRRCLKLLSLLSQFVISLYPFHRSGDSDFPAPYAYSSDRNALPARWETAGRPVNANPDPKNCYLPASGYLLIDSQHATEARAHQRAQQLQQLGFGKCSIIWLPCAGQATEQYGLQLGPVYSSRKTAEQQLKAYQGRRPKTEPGGALPQLIAL